MAYPAIREGGRSRSRRSADLLRQAAPIVMVAAGLVLLLIAALWGPPTRPAPAGSASERVADPLGIQTGAKTTHVNELGGYLIEVPAGWTVRDRRSASELISPDERFVMSFGSGPRGSLRDAARALLDSIRSGYRGVHAGLPEPTLLNGQRAVVISGRLRNAEGIRVRFIGLATRLGGENRVIGVFVSQPADPAEVLPVVEQVLGSFEAV